VWAALAAGPVALAVVCAMPRTVAATAQPTTTAPAALRNPDPAGVATLFCDLWLRSDATHADSTTAQAVHALAPSVDLPTRSASAAAQSLLRTVAVRSARLSDGSWSVVVAAQFTVRNDGSGSSSAADADARTVVRYFAVPVVASDTAGGTGAFTVTAAPAEIAGVVGGQGQSVAGAARTQVAQSVAEGVREAIRTRPSLPCALSVACPSSRTPHSTMSESRI
jgi:hypothetical protein